MRYWLSAALLANIALFLVEFHFGAFESALPEEKTNDLQKEREIYSNKNNDAYGQPNIAASPFPFAETKNQDADSPNAAWPKIEPSPRQDNITLIDPQDWPPSLTKAPSQSGTETSPLLDGNADSSAEKTAPSVQLSSSVELPPTQTFSSSPEPLKDPTAQQEPAAAPASAPPASAEDVHPAETPPTSALPESPQKNDKKKTAQPVSALEKPAKVEITPARSARSEVQSVKNNNLGNESQVKEIRPAQETLHNPEKVLSACYIARPIDRVETLNALLRQFRPQLIELAMSPQAGKTRKHNKFVVYYPAPPSIKESFQMATTLKDNYGIKDLQVIRDGEMKGAISLGVFSNQRNAEAAQSRFGQQGLQVQIKPPSPTENAYKVRMRWTANQEPVAEQLVDALSQSYPDIQRISSCE